MQRIIETRWTREHYQRYYRARGLGVYYLWFWFSVPWRAFRSALKDKRATNDDGARARGRESRHTRIIILLNDPLIIVSKQIDAPVRCTRRCHSSRFSPNTSSSANFCLVTNTITLVVIKRHTSITKIVYIVPVSIVFHNLESYNRILWQTRSSFGLSLVYCY